MSQSSEQKINMELLKEARLQDDNLMQLHRELVQKKTELVNALNDLTARILVGKDLGYYPAKIVSVRMAKIIELHNTLNRLQDAETAEFIRYLDEAYIANGEES